MKIHQQCSYLIILLEKKHVLDPIFEIADKLNFQLICFAAPEIIKVEISERFPVFWELKIDEGKIVHGGRVIKQ